jgi:hypothetical protein
MKSIISKSKYWEKKPLQLILLIAIIVRLVAVIFSKGYGMHDDHFLVIETAQSWLDGASYNNWFHDRVTGDKPTILSFIYAGFHYLLFALMEGIGLLSPQVKMLVVRMLHAAFSLLTIIFAFRITNKLSDQKTAFTVGLLLAVYWFMPFFSVRNLVEMVCIPFIMWGYWIILKYGDDEKVPWGQYLLAGIMFGLAFSLRFQTLIISGGIGLVLLFQRKWLGTLYFGLGILFVILVTQGVSDFIIWGRPFAELREYIMHNIGHRYEYIVAPWYSYILTIIGVLVLPVSLFMAYGFFRQWKKHLVIFLPVLLFFLFHSYFPNKQERFIIPILPLFIMLGMIGWNEFINGSSFWQRNRAWIRGGWIFFFVVNTIAMVMFTTFYSKKARVEAMVYLSDKSPVNELVLEDSNRDHATFLPLFYLRQWPDIYEVTRLQPAESLADRMSKPPGDDSLYILLIDEINLDKRVEELQSYFPGMYLEATVVPGAVDRLLHWLNPVNANLTIYIYRYDKKISE